jgi:ADP-ribose pyrophosphatase YjhB (NUDIX family)
MNQMSSETQFYILAVVTNDKGEILIVKRLIEPPISTISGLGDTSLVSWFIPIGKQKQGEAREECVLRNVLAETGYRVQVLYQIPNSLRLHPEFPNILKCAFLCKIEDKKQLENWQQPKYIQEVKWVKPEKLKDYIAEQLLATCPPAIAKALGI